MLPFSVLWKWLWVNFVPLEAEEVAQDEDQIAGIKKDSVACEFLRLKDVNKAEDKRAQVFAKALIGRYLCLLFKDSPLLSTRFTDSENKVFYIKRVTEEAEQEERATTLPPFPQDLRVQMLRELREERMGRSSARNLLQLMTQSPTKKRTAVSCGGEEDAEDRENSPSSSQQGAAHEEMMIEEAGGAGGEGGDLSPQENEEAASPTQPRSTKKQATKPSARTRVDLPIAVLEQGTEAAAETVLPATAATAEFPSSSAAAASIHAAPYRAFRRQASSPLLMPPRKGQTSSSHHFLQQQEPWKRELGDLWAKQLATMREINALKIEMGRREAARQREFLAMRQELDIMRGSLPSSPSSSPPLLLSVFDSDFCAAELFRIRHVGGSGGGTAADRQRTDGRNKTNKTKRKLPEGSSDMHGGGGVEETPRASCSLSAQQESVAASSSQTETSEYVVEPSRHLKRKKVEPTANAKNAVVDTSIPGATIPLST
ncbi:Transcriptional regulator [Balamuthia mandrillaris]